MPEDSIPCDILDSNPDTYELVTYAKTAEWNMLGITLKLDGESLKECRDCANMYQKWLEGKKSETTRRNLIAALRAIKQNRVADDYVDHLKTLVSLFN